jgi:hypothetical protein
LSDDPSHREHIHRVMLNAVCYVGVSKLMAKHECSKSAAVLYALNEGLYRLGMIKKDDYELLRARYGRKLVDVIQEAKMGREPSHVPILAIEQVREKRVLAEKNRQFQGMIAQWELHTKPSWRAKAVVEAEKWRDKLQSARDLLELHAKTGNSEETLKKIMMVDDTTCVDDELPLILMDFAPDLSKGNLALDGTGAHAVFPLQSLHI